MGYLIFKSVLLPLHLIRKLAIVSFTYRSPDIVVFRTKFIKEGKTKFIKECRTKKSKIHSFSFVWKQRGGHGKQWWLWVYMSKVRSPVAVTSNYPIARTTLLKKCYHWKVYLSFYYKFVITDILSKSAIILMFLFSASLQKNLII